MEHVVGLEEVDVFDGVEVRLVTLDEEDERVVVGTIICVPSLSGRMRATIDEPP